MSDANLIEIAKKFTLESFSHDDYIFRQDDEGEKFYIILKGCVVGISEASKYFLKEGFGAAGEDKEVCRLTEGMGFGELALISGASRSLSMKAYNEVLVVSLHKSEFLKCFGVFLYYLGQSDEQNLRNSAVSNESQIPTKV